MMLNGDNHEPEGSAQALECIGLLLIAATDPCLVCDEGFDAIDDTAATGTTVSSSAECM